MPSVSGVPAPSITGNPLVLVVALLAALAFNEILFRALRRAGRSWADRGVIMAVTRRCWWPARFVLKAIAVSLVLPAAGLSPATFVGLQHALELVLIGASAWMVVALTFALEDVAVARFRIDAPNNLRARRVRTRVNVIRRITVVFASIVAFAAALTTFEIGRSFGTTLLASAGILSVIVGIAARPALSNLLAGLQIFFAEPFRIDDVIVIEGEWGRIEEITLTNIVVRTWDERRLVLPIQYFLNQPFQNWTRHTTHLLATAFIAVDYTTPVERVREELRNILEQSENWDRRTWNLQVTDATERTVQLRALMTARDAPTAWDLRCEVREKLLAFLQHELPSALPRQRVDMVQDGVRAYAPNSLSRR
jgi:small-conductance mechanosensitive channel